MTAVFQDAVHGEGRDIMILDSLSGLLARMKAESPANYAKWAEMLGVEIKEEK